MDFNYIPTNYRIIVVLTNQLCRLIISAIVLRRSTYGVRVPIVSGQKNVV